MRFIMIGGALVFAGFVILGIFGENFQTANIESEEFGTCYEYFEDKEPIPIPCSDKMVDQSSFFALIVGIIIAGGIALIKGIRGDWDSKVKPEDMVGPGRDNRKDGNDSDTK
ncbi:MAG: hypothetical protein R3237_01350 [Nitrosopumilaceae archaeon]|nr:hypothetical protein [Nitrosopumilaceae archaeon]